MNVSAGRRGEEGRGGRALPALVLALACCAAPLHAQTSGLLEPTLPDDYNQSRNLSVIERARPDYDPLGYQLGSFAAYPRLDLGIATTDNAYLTAQGRKGDIFGRIAPAVDVRSDWDRHMVILSAEGTFFRYLQQQPLDRDTWDIRSVGRLDVGDFGNVSLEAQASKLQEDPFTSQTDASLAILSSYRRDHAALRVEREMGRSRFLASVDATRLRFSEILSPDGEVESQAQRNRGLVTGAAQAEYALSPGAVLLARFAYTDTDYASRLADGGPNRDAGSIQALAGFNLDLPQFIRGTIQVGYTRKDYRAAAYASVEAVTGAVKLEYFLSDIMNFEIEAHRSIEDSATSDNNPYVESMASLGADRSLRENIIASLRIGAGRQNYLGSTIHYDVVQASASLKYLISHSLSTRLDAAYGRRASPGAGQTIDQSTLILTVELQR